MKPGLGFERRVSLEAPWTTLAAGSFAATGLRLGLLAILALGLAAAGYAAWRAARGKGGPPADLSDKMPVLSHVEELRRRILWSMAWVLAAAAFAFSFRVERTVGGYYVPRAAVADNLAAQAFAAMAEHLVPAGVQLVVMRPIDAVMAELGIALAIGFAVAMPALLWNAGRFVAPALQPRERRVLARALLPALGLFAAGMAFCWLAVLPLLLETLYGYADPLGATPLLRIDDLVNFTVGLLLAFGIAFQTPLVMYALARVGLVSAAEFAKAWRYALIAILVLSALFTDPTVVSQVLVAVPLFGLYLLGIAMAQWGGAAFKRTSR